MRAGEQMALAPTLAAEAVTASRIVSLRHGCGAGVRGGGLAGGVREGQVAAGGGGIRQQCVKSTRDSGSVAVRRKT